MNRLSILHPTVFKGLAWPPRGGKDEKRSLLAHSKLHKPAPPPPTSQLQAAKDRIYATYPKTECPRAFAGKVHTVTDQQILAAAYQLKKESSPGFPLGMLSSSKGLLVDDHGDFLVDVVRERLNALSMDLLGDPTPMELYRLGLCDPVRVFVKNEPHSEVKIANDRLRLIASVSAADEIIERLLCGSQNETEIDQWETCPSKPGIGFSDAQTIRFVESTKEQFLGKQMSEADVSAWDWCVQEWMLDAEAELRIKLCGAAPESAFARILTNRIKCLGRSLIVTSDGVLFEQTSYGIMKSGSYLTSSSNSRMRNLVAHLVGADVSVAMGDDSLEETVDGALEKYRDLGINVKFYKNVGSKFEFCSNAYDLTVDPPVAVPQNWQKGFYRLLSGAPSLELLVQFMHEYRHLENLEVVKALILESGWISKANKKDDEEQEEVVQGSEASCESRGLAGQVCPQ